MKPLCQKLFGVGDAGVVERGHDMPRWVNLPLRADLKTKVEAPGWADERGHRGCNICDRSQIHDDNLRQCEKIKNRRVIFDPAAFEFLTN